MKNLITIGGFDGVHKGHQQIIRCAVKQARCINIKCLVLYFNKPPKSVLYGADSGFYITSPAEKRKIILSLGADEAIGLDFNRRFANISREKFFSETLIKKYNMGALLVGRDFAFGKNRLGHIDFLRRQCAANKIPLFIVSFFKSAGHKISSSVIRRALAEGDIKRVNNLLGRPYSIEGRVVRGQGLGGKISYPTANIDADSLLITPSGVFAVKAQIGGKLYNAVCNIGFRPTIEAKGKKIIEAHILNFKRNIYGKKISLYFLNKIRAEKKFKNLQELKRAVAADIKKAFR